MDQGQFISAEAARLNAALNRGDRAEAAVFAATLQQELHTLMLDLDPASTTLARIVMHNGRYIDEPSTEYSPLDSLKEVVAVVENLLTTAADEIAGSGHVDEDDPVFEIIDAARRELVLALGRHVPGISWHMVPLYTKAAAHAARTFDDGSPVWKLIAVAEYGDEYLATWSPRRDGPLEAFKEKMRALHRARALSIVDDVDPSITEQVEAVFDGTPDEGEDG
jgi:hypothetical protein